MSRPLANPGGHRDYGATSSTTANIPDVDFAGFSPTEMMSLSENIAQNINAIRSSWMQLDKAFKLIDTNRDTTQAIRDKIVGIQTDTNTKIQATKSDLQRLSTVFRRGDKQQQLQVDKLTSDFKTVVQKYSESQQSIAIKMKQLFLQSAHAQEQDEEALIATSDNEDQIQRQKQLHANLEFEQDALKDRETRIRQIESIVIDVNDIMKDLNVLVHQQGETIDTIESSIDHACTEVEAGASEIRKAAEYRTRYRRKILILLVIAVIVGLIVTGIIVSQLKS